MKKRKKKLGKDAPPPERYTIIDVLISPSCMEFAIFDEDETEVAHGYIKWDNCSNWELNEQMHFCGLEEMKEFHKAMDRCYEIASQKMENWLTDEIVRSWGKAGMV